MQTVNKIVRLFGGLDWLKAGNYIRLDNEPYMRLVIEYIGTGPRGLPLLSIAHYFEQNGDQMRDPDLVCEVDAAGGFHPVSFRQDSTGTYNEAVFQDEQGKTMCRPGIVKDLKAFARVWNRNLSEQGFYAAAQQAVAGKVGAAELTDSDDGLVYNS